MEGKKLIIFDKDGTLMDSSPGSFSAFEEMARMYGLKLAPRDTWLKALCGSFSHNIKWLFDLKDEEVAEKAVEFVKVYGSIEGYYDFKEYPGVDEMITELSGRYMLSVATMMFRDFAVKSLQAMDLEGCFLTIEGAVLTQWLSKQDLLDRCLSTADVTPEETVLVGDCMDDLESARAAGMDFVGVTYGYQLTEEDCLREGVPFARTPKELLDIL